MKTLKKVLLKNKFGALVYVLLGISIAFLSSYSVHYFQKLIDDFSEGALGGVEIALYGSLLLMVCLLNYVDEWPSKTIANKLYYDLKWLALEKTGKLDYQYYVALGTGETLKKIEAGAEAGKQILYDFYFCLIRELLPQMLFSILFIGMVDRRLLWILGAGYVLVPLVTQLLLVILKKIKEGILADEEQANHLWIRAFMEMVTFRLNGIFGRELLKVGRLHKRLIATKVKMTLVHEAFFSLFAFLVTLLKVGLLIFAWRTGSISVGGLVTILALVDNAYTPIAIFSVLYVSYKMDVETFKRFEGFMTAAEDDGLKAANRCVPCSNAIAFHGVRYGYADKKVLTPLSLEMPYGSKIAFVGESGSGKSTVTKLLAGLLKPQEGQIKLGEEDLSTIDLNHYYEKLVYVTQEAPIFDGTLRENLLCGEASDYDIWETLEAVQLKSVVKTWPKGIDTPVGESGTLLSGGERQRVALARLWFKSPNWIVLDEATSAMDNLTEAAVMDALLKRFENQTVVAIAHRLDAMRAFNRWVVFKDGTVMGDGKRETLLETVPYFKALVQGNFEVK